MPDNSNQQLTIESLIHANAQLQRENEQLRGLIGSNQGPTAGKRTCVRCGRSWPDGPAYWPGYTELISPNATVEMQRHQCVYCRNDDGQMHD